jgi:exopolysaccharide biosynthesis protein
MFNTRQSCNSCKCKYLQPIRNRIQFSQYQTATQKYIRKKFLSNTTITTSAVIMVATQTNNRLKEKLQKKLQHLQKQYSYVCLTGCNFRNRAIATSVIRRLLTMNQSKTCVLRRLQLLRDYSWNSCN